ncbi:MAG: ROK family protein [Candidatus Limnocylindrales bacterium]
MARLRPGSGTLIRDLNLSAILALIGREGPIARIDIARRLALSPATVTILTRDLVGQGLVREVDQAPSTGGRPAILLGLVGSAAHVIGMKIAAERVTAVDVSLDGEPIAYAERPFDASSPDCVEALGDIVEGLVAGWSDPSRRLLGVGLGLPGVIDAPSGTVDSPLLGWHDLPLGRRLEERVGVPILLENDVNTLAVAERLYGRGMGLDHFATITIGRGVGLGIVVGGELYRGACGGAGELGHVRVLEDGPACTCGGHGCLEAVVADPALVREAVEEGILPPDGDIVALRVLANAGDPAALTVFARAGRILGGAVAGLVNILSPSLLLVSGEGTQSWPHLAATFDAALRDGLFGPLRGLVVEVDPWDDTKWARGAASLVLRATFSSPLWVTAADDAVRGRLTAPAGSV